MNDDVLRQINHALQAKGLRTVELFTSDALTQATIHSRHPDVLQGHFNDWQAARYDPKAASSLNIRQTLEFQRNTLAQRQFRCDGTDEELQKIIDDIESVKKHYQDTKTARQLVRWWSEYVELHKELTAKQATI